MSARMGIFQECLYAEYGKRPREALFFIHMLSLPGFLTTSQSIYSHVLKFNKSLPLPEMAMVPVLSGVPKLWLYTIANALTQFICISSVFTLTSECSALTVTLVLTLRKFLSLLFSILYFQNPFTSVHWMGTVMVFGGTLLFADVFSKVFGTTKHKKEE
ncbi:UNVERIFIED_CONTAM: hypothetical protein GTU68_004947 [Idotea baltica]|nr:hypothetical protein [Idotea baltica]